jgi:hypothetical protein
MVLTFTTLGLGRPAHFYLYFIVKLQLKQAGLANHGLNLHYSWLRKASPFYLDFIVKLLLKQAGLANHSLNPH